MKELIKRIWDNDYTGPIILFVSIVGAATIFLLFIYFNGKAKVKRCAEATDIIMSIDQPTTMDWFKYHQACSSDSTLRKLKL